MFLLVAIAFPCVLAFPSRTFFFRSQFLDLNPNLNNIHLHSYNMNDLLGVEAASKLTSASDSASTISSNIAETASTMTSGIASSATASASATGATKLVSTSAAGVTKFAAMSASAAFSSVSAAASALTSASPPAMPDELGANFMQLKSNSLGLFDGLTANLLQLKGLKGLSDPSALRDDPSSLIAIGTVATAVIIFASFQSGYNSYVPDLVEEEKNSAIASYLGVISELKSELREMEGKLSAHEATSATKISNLEKVLAETEFRFKKEIEGAATSLSEAQKRLAETEIKFKKEIEGAAISLSEAEKKFEKNSAPVVKASTEAPVSAPAPSPVAVVAAPPSPPPTPPPEDPKIAEMRAKVETSKRTIIGFWARLDSAALSRKTTTECRQFLNSLGISTKNSWGVELQKKDLILKVEEVVSMEVVQS